MKFESGNLAFSMLELPMPLPQDLIEKFASRRAGPIEEVGCSGAQIGFASARCLLDSEISEHKAMFGGYVHLVLRIAERKVQTAMLEAECRLEELAAMKAEGKSFLQRKQRYEIRSAVIERLLPSAQPVIRSIPFIYAPGAFHLYVGATAPKQLDLFNSIMVETFGFCGAPSTPETLGELFKKVSITDLPGSCFSPEKQYDSTQHHPGREFLTWLWFASETSGNRIHVENGSPIVVLVEGPMRFFNEGNGAFSAVISKGVPENSAEAKSCLVANKKLKQARVVFCRNEETQWRFTLSADDFAVKGMKLPQTESIDAVSRFQERMAFLEEWRNDFTMIFNSYLDIRTDSRAWPLEISRIREWIESKQARS